MNVSFDFVSVNWLAVMIAAVAAFVLGGAWYSPVLFGRLLPDLSLNNEVRTGKSPNVVAIFVTAFIMLWVAACFLAGLIGPTANARQGLDVGVTISLFFVIAPLAISSMFGSRPVPLVVITAAYFVACYGLMGLILGAMH
ncbi:MAG: DUF1761 domain-containing protein [Gammaproteobacteria bacterium]|nr:DUF1761 domain-containing protein [Gammaproteobacteria bacterium]